MNTATKLLNGKKRNIFQSGRGAFFVRDGDKKKYGVKARFIRNRNGSIKKLTFNMVDNVPVILRPKFKKSNNDVKKRAKRAENAARAEAVRRSQEEAKKLRLQCKMLWEKFKKEESNEEARKRQKKAEEERQRKVEEERQRKAEEERQRKAEEERRRRARQQQKKAEEERQRKAEEERRRRARQQQQKADTRPPAMNANTKKIFDNLLRSKDKISIRKAYLRGSLKLHPNKGGNAELFKKFKAIYNRRK